MNVTTGLILVYRNENYKRALFVFDSGFLALLATILWTIVNMVLQLVIAFVCVS